MATINSGALRSKLNAFLNSAEGKQKVAGCVDASTDIAAVESAFVGVMLGCASGASGVASDFHACGASISTGRGEIIATIPFEFGNKHRDSLYPAGYSGVDNIVALFNNGYSARNTVYGLWHGSKIKSLQSRDGLRFIQAAKQSFEGAQIGNARVLSIEIDGEYE